MERPAQLHPLPSTAMLMLPLLPQEPLPPPPSALEINVLHAQEMPDQPPQQQTLAPALLLVPSAPLAAPLRWPQASPPVPVTQTNAEPAVQTAPPSKSAKALPSSVSQRLAPQQPLLPSAQLTSVLTAFAHSAMMPSPLPNAQLLEEPRASVTLATLSPRFAMKSNAIVLPL